MTLNVSTIFGIVTSHVSASGLFDRVTQHEPKNAPGNGLSAAIWVQQLAPINGSGLAATSARLELSVRVYKNMLSEPQDEIDPDILAATDALVRAYVGDFELGSEARAIDVRGMYGPGLSADASYLTQDGRLYRAMVIRLPIIINDLWNEVA